MLVELLTARRNKEGLVRNMSDPRYIRIKSAIEKLSTEQIQKILSYNQEMVYDEFNFDETAKRY